ncbi:class I SAM-dependent methyltransferase [Scytonema hofmannii FACHB-248]|uniref:Class I SAM-dependent methyltransferase n=1 Tax=Scytonema hofmannii FACHB-248 TaxID=1842502 RepID=A0ABR8GV83_9CYAN|nr:MULTISPECIES: class I SAM-dependent methyltransferase [Nostocales]MBD2607030.1 class I SAM-dependent methyltransferase [Scytonema hofmannii FACHB-248]
MVDSSAFEAYDLLSQYYDSMQTKARNYLQVGQTLGSLIGNRKTLLEIGVGTGLTVEALLLGNPSYEIWGIDNHQPLLEQAKEKFKHQENVHLDLQDVLNLKLSREFDVVYSRGGALSLMNLPDGCYFISHIMGRDANLKALKGIAKHLQNEGLFIISAEKYKSSDDALTDSVVYSKEIMLDDGVIHHRKVERKSMNSEDYIFFDFSFRTDQEIIGRKVIELFSLNYQDYQKLFMEAGLYPVEIELERDFQVYSKVKQKQI